MSTSRASVPSDVAVVGVGFLVGPSLLANLFNLSWASSIAIGVATTSLFCGSFFGGRFVGLRRRR